MIGASTPVLGGVSAIWYPVKTWELAKQFYSATLGLAETHCNDSAGWVAYATGGPPLFLMRKADMTGGGAVVTFRCDDLELLRARLVQAGVRVEPSLQEGAQVRILTFFDPDGNRLEAAEPK